MHSSVTVFCIARVLAGASYYSDPGRGPGAVVKASCLESRRLRLRTPLWLSSFKNVSSPLTRKDSILSGASVTCSASDHQGSNFKSCVWRAVSHLYHHPQEVFLTQFSLYVHNVNKTPFISFYYSGRCRWEFISLQSVAQWPCQG